MIKNDLKNFLYLFFTTDSRSWKYKRDMVWIATIGKSTRPYKKRLASYHTTNAGIEFEYIREVPLNQNLDSKEKALKRELRKKYSQYLHSPEQFIIGDDQQRDIFESEISRYMEPLEQKRSNIINYEFNNLYDENVDIRNHRPPCQLIPGEVAMITTKAGLGEVYRTYKMRFEIKSSGRIVYFSKPKEIYVCEKAHRILMAMNKLFVPKPEMFTNLEQKFGT